MAHELERTSKNLVPDASDAQDAMLAPWFQAPEMTARPDWTELRVPYREDNDLEHKWSVIVLPVRFLALGTLWITFSVYRFGIFIAFITLIALVFFVR